MPADQPKPLCGAPTRRGRSCRNPAVKGGGVCRIHLSGKSLGITPTPAASSPDAVLQGAEPPPAVPVQTDPLVRLQILQDAAEARALAAHRADEGANAEKRDAAFARNARLAATLARLRLTLSRARAEEDADEAGGDGDSDAGAEIVIYKLPDNGR